MSFRNIPSIDFMSSLFSTAFKAFKDSTCFISWSSKASTRFIPWTSFVFICFSNALPRGEYVNFA